MFRANLRACFRCALGKNNILKKNKLHEAALQAPHSTPIFGPKIQVDKRFLVQWQQWHDSAGCVVSSCPLRSTTTTACVRCSLCWLLLATWNVAVAAVGNFGKSMTSWLFIYQSGWNESSIWTWSWLPTIREDLMSQLHRLFFCPPPKCQVRYSSLPFWPKYC